MSPPEGTKSEKLGLTEMTASTGIGPPKHGYVLTVSNLRHGEPPVTVDHTALKRAVGFVVCLDVDTVWWANSLVVFAFLTRRLA